MEMKIKGEFCLAALFFTRQSPAADGVPVGGDMTYLRIFTGGLYFLLETEAITEIVKAGERRQDEIPVYSLGDLTGTGADGRETYILILAGKGRKAGIAVSAADEIVAVTEAGICPLPPEVHTQENRYLRAAVYSKEVPSGLEYILDPENLLERAEMTKPEYHI